MRIRELPAVGLEPTLPLGNKILSLFCERYILIPREME